MNSLGSRFLFPFTFLLTILLITSNSWANSVTFTNIADDQGSGISFSRTPSATNDVWPSFIGQAIPFEQIPTAPSRTRGVPGVAIFDYDNDGDLDIYASNGPGTANSLYANQLTETGNLSFIDVATSAGVDATDHDSSGIVYADTDNDGDHDLLVLSMHSPNRFFRNNGDGTFTDITNTGDIGDADYASSSASFGDVNGDGLVDLAVGNTFDHDTTLPVFVFPYSGNQPNQLFLNKGNNVFEDVSQSSGILNLTGFNPPAPPGAATITWAVTMIDYDQDGDTDILFGDDQGAIPNLNDGGLDRGLIHIMQNDGDGNFTDVNVAANTNESGSWMGFAFADFNSDGNIDFFGSNFGDYPHAFALQAPLFGVQTSKWYLGQNDNSFSDPGVGSLGATPFGWGAVARDYDNDGDTDFVFHGGLNTTVFFELSNPGAYLENDGQANFTYNPNALDPGADHLHRLVEGVAVGDLNSDGFVDIVSVANTIAPPGPLSPLATLGAFLNPPTVLPFDGLMEFHFNFIPLETGEFTFNPDTLNFANGNMTVEINNADNNNRWVMVDALGTVGITGNGSVNRDGLGAVIRFTPRYGNTVIQPIMGGSSFASQSSLTAHFGLGTAYRGTVDILWPGGVKNRLYNVFHGSSVLFPEIPCSIDTDDHYFVYTQCVADSLHDLVQSGVLSPIKALRFFVSAARAYIEEH